MTNKIESFDNWDQLNRLAEIDFNSGKFEANGNTYFLETKLSISRFVEFQILQRELAMGMSVQDVYNSLKDCRALLNQTRFVDVAVFIDKILNHCSKLKEKEPIMLKICTLFCNTENEDRNTWGNDLVVKKLEDWKKSGINVQCFFHIALRLAPGFIELYNKFIQDISLSLEVTPEILNAINQESQEKK